MSLVQTERETYETMWAVEAYAANSPGEQLVSIFQDMAGRHSPVGGATWLRSASVLDAGCGSGKGALALRKEGYAVTLCDLTQAGLVPEAKALPFHPVLLWDDVVRVTGRHDYVYCCDVMEHIPPTFGMLVAHQMIKVARKGVFFSISLVPDVHGVWVGKSLHQNVQSFNAWRDQLATIGHVLECRDLLINGIFFVRER